ncbi:hypothetical protein Nepgr_017464 [Nepenthes gracilis]|uniref:Uncharacterized protein n=1 Tax=Nepenthes gracilis TaxID=150966 RepID=A0AAD3SQF4_NEPGR|nr:hypothetical protein Nepgr_017464 [Nepenthes gracilis]
MLRHLHDSNRSITASKSHRSNRDLLLGKQRNNNSSQSYNIFKIDSTKPDAGELTFHLIRYGQISPKSHPHPTKHMLPITNMSTDRTGRLQESGTGQIPDLQQTASSNLDNVKPGRKGRITDLQSATRVGNSASKPE